MYRIEGRHEIEGLWLGSGVEGAEIDGDEFDVP
jgi:hypothetical protein